jgi:CubicO group peptidase (beta-lactamase class C family)
MIDQLITARAERAIQDGVFPGCVIGYVKKDGTRKVLPFGKFTYDADSSSVKEDTIYDGASLTKSIPTGSIALALIDQGKLRVTDKLIDYLPEFNNSDRENVLIKHLLTYTIDGYGLARAVDGTTGKLSIGERTSDDLFRILFNQDFEKRPGEVFKYSNIPSALLGLVIERITGSTLDKLGDEMFFRPLGMTRTTFFPEKFNVNEVVPTEIDEWRGLAHGVVHDESAYVCKRGGKLVGHAGIFLTAGDTLTFLEMLLNKGILGGKTYLSENIIEQIQTNQIPELGDYTGLGWELNQPRYMGKHCTERTFGKTGFTGTLCVCDIEKEIAYVILSNRIYPKRSEDSSAINSFRADIGDIILGEGIR